MRTDRFSIVFLLIIFSLGCNRYLKVDRTQFLKDGEVVPTVDLSYYRSVQERAHQDSSLAVTLAISGGGSRAANFAIGIMMGLEQIDIRKTEDALDQVDYLSTVSGGGFAGGAYISAMFEHNYFSRKGPFILADYVKRHIKEDLSVSYTGRLIKGFFNTKIWFNHLDYGDALEQSIDNHVLGYKRRKDNPNAKSIKLSDVFIRRTDTESPVLYPMHFTNSSVIGTMAIFPFTPDILATYRVNGYTHRMKTIEQQRQDPFDIPLSVGIKASGSFPVLIPNSTLQSVYVDNRPFLHVMDGAMTDNQGYFTALQVLNQDNSAKKVMIIIDADASGHLYTFSKKKGNYSGLKIFFSLAASGLYARRATLRRELETNGNKFGIEPIFLGFYTLIEDIPLPDKLPSRIKLKESQERLVEILKNNPDPESISVLDRHILYEVLVNIGTKYTIKPTEQELLILSGQLITRIASEKIKKAMTNN